MPDFCLKENRNPISTIAKVLGYHKSTIYRELKRNKGCRLYFPERAQRFAYARAKLRIRKPIITGGLKKRITTRLSKCWSPEIIVGRMKDEKVASLSHETIYRFLRKNEQHATKLKFYKRRGYRTLSSAHGKA